MTTKQYLKFIPGNVFGVVASSSASIVPIESSEGLRLKDNFFAVAANEDAYIWNLRTKEKAQVFKGEDSYVTCLVTDSNDKNISIGYGDGTIRVFDLKTAACIVSFIGHKSAVSCLTFDDSGANLVSGGKDSEIVLWNLTEEAGVFRLRGHKGPVTKCLFLKEKNVLVSSSMDTFVKFWDLDTQHCFYTLVGCHKEILDMALVKTTQLICGLRSGDLKFWKLCFDNSNMSITLPAKRARTDERNDSESDMDINSHDEDEDEVDSEEKFKTFELGYMNVQEKRVSAIVVDPSERLMGVHGNAKCLWLYKILSEEEIERKLQKKRNKLLKRKKDDADCALDEVSVALQEEFNQFKKPIRMEGKIDSFYMSVDAAEIAKVTVSLKSNTIVQYELDLKVKNFNPEIIRSVSIPGHRSFVRTLSYSFDGSSVLSASDESVKIWRSFQDEQKCTTTMVSDAALCSLFVPGNNYCIVGTKKGNLNIYDVEKRALVNSIDAHENAVHCMCLSPGDVGVTTGGSDKTVKFWEFELVREDEDAMKTLSVIKRRVLEMPEEILCVKYSPDGKRIAISLLDSTVQVLFADSLKLAFSLYGHEFPVSCMDISYDSTLIVTGSHDRTVRIWSMEFGSCNKRIRIANEKGLQNDKGITCVQFLPKSHLFFTGSKDHLVRQWDADNFQKIITLKGHQNEVTAMAMSPDGTYVITASRDRSIRMWEKTSEPLVLEEQREIEEEEKEKEIEDLPAIPGEGNKEVALPGMKTIETIKTVDQLIEAMDLYEKETTILQEYELECKNAGKRLAPPPVNPLFMAYRIKSPLEYMRKATRKIKPSELEGALLHLPFSYVLDLLRIISEFANLGWDSEFCEKCATFLIKVNIGQITTTRNFSPVIKNLREKLFKNMYHIRDVVGFTKVISNLHQREIEAREEVSMFTGILNNIKKKRKKNRRKEHAVISFV